MRDLLRQVFALVVKELKLLGRDREALILLFAMPLFFILVMSWALQGVYQVRSKQRPIEILVVRNDSGKLAHKVLADLRKVQGLVLVESQAGAPLSLSSAEDLVGRGRFALALVLQKGFSAYLGKGSRKSAEKALPAELIADPALNRQLLASLQGTIGGVLQRQLLLARLGKFMAGLDEKAIASHTALLPTRLPRGFKYETRPTATEQHVPAYTIFGVFFIVLTLAASFLREKQEGTFRRILTAPLSKPALLVGKLIPYYLVNLIQIAIMFAVGALVFQVRLGNIAALILVSLALAAAANGLGLLVASIGRTEAQVNGLAVILAVTLSALGGMLVPSFLMPAGMRLLSRFTPHAWALEGYHDVMIRGLGVWEVLHESAILLGFAALFFSLSLWLFRFDSR